ncbi:MULTISPECIES: DNA-directed RNA polymerase subunit beta [Clostridia]|uniref:DNA-directed RNA polymerase subunit beta n=1 Tax=Clostridia TaxID=186801 RepID=UPI000EA393A6|nr:MULTISPECIES: DNA-directed RNA polymerase subunit beta [Clostridia]NBJ68774.1 DNA-directed RNA polymerase subunit beta [Roseburia sp. 1XD42-34]RKI80156.1 DNA-directed RNA polymerase subunit beta [Clostridium sp. 1xD42-85]
MSIQPQDPTFKGKYSSFRKAWEQRWQEKHQEAQHHNESNGRDRVKQQSKQIANKKNRRPRVRIFPIWLRIIVILLFCIIALVVGLMIGYGVIGDGAPTDVLKTETWQHIIDIVTKPN